VPAGIIVDVEATPALRTDEVNSARTMIERVEVRIVQIIQTFLSCSIPAVDNKAIRL